ncbi:MAG TPA: hypothetical protein VN853_03750 [Polyangia bacterium]|jgi:hypothetical protein|nr:hypothetical protein [Polyangia bacterium]
MYWRSGQYKVLRGYDAKTRNRVLAEALARYGRATNRRFFLAVASWLGVIIAVVTSARAGRTPAGWRLWVIPGVVGVLFYLYLLWEINGPIRAAVERYVKERKK